MHTRMVADLSERGFGNISNCLFEKNVALGHAFNIPNGGGLAWGGNGIVQDCTLIENVSFNASAMVAGNASGLLTDCCMADNFSFLGNTLRVTGESEPTVTNILIVDPEEGSMGAPCPIPSGLVPPGAPGLFGSDLFARVVVTGGSTQTIDITDQLTVGLNGAYEKDQTGTAVTATLTTPSVLLTNSLAIAAPFDVCTPACVPGGDPDAATCCRRPLISLEDAMDIDCIGDFVIDGAEGGPFGTIIPPPKLRTDGTAAIRNRWQFRTHRRG